MTSNENNPKEATQACVLFVWLSLELYFWAAKPVCLSVLLLSDAGCC